MADIINKVANSGIITIDLDEFLPKIPIEILDIKPWLFNEIVLKEKDFRNYVTNHNWENYEGKMVVVCCSTDAIIPSWAFLLIGTTLQPFAHLVYYGSQTQALNQYLLQQISQLNFENFTEKRVVVKGCGKLDVSPGVYLALAQSLKPFVKSLMFGEPCSTVPIYKKPKS